MKEITLAVGDTCLFRRVWIGMTEDTSREVKQKGLDMVKESSCMEVKLAMNIKVTNLEISFCDVYRNS